MPDDNESLVSQVQADLDSMNSDSIPSAPTDDKPPPQAERESSTGVDKPTPAEEPEPPAEAEDVPTTAAETETPEPPKEASALDERTLQIADEMGLDVEKLDPNIVQKAVDRAEMLAFERFRELTAPPQQGEPEPAKKQDEPPETKEPAPTEPLPKFELGIDLSHVDDDIVAAIDKMGQYVTDLQNRLDSVNQIVESQWQREQDQILNSTTAWFDEKLSGAGDESVFGKGKLDDLPPNSAQYNKRVEFWNKYLDFCDFRRIDPYQKNDELLSLLLRVEGASHEPSQKLKQLSDTVKRRQGQSIGRPTNRRTSRAVKEQDKFPGTDYSHEIVNDVQQMIDDMQASR